MKLERSAQKAFLMVGCFLLGIAGVAVGERTLRAWGKSVEELDGTRERLRRFHGWLAVDEEVSALRDRVWGSFGRLSGEELGWEGLVKFQAAAGEAGLEVREFRPARAAAAAGKAAPFLLDAKVAGKLDQLSNLLRALPEAIPGVELEGLQLSPLEGGQVLGVLRLRWRGP